MSIDRKPISRWRESRVKRRTVVWQRWCVLATISLACLSVAPGRARAQDSGIRYGARISADVKLVYDRGLKYLASSQKEDGSWDGRQQNGVTGICLMAFLASGEDPNFGRYRSNIQKAVRSIIRSQDPRTGYIPNSMYNHGFATLGLAEAYGAVDDSLLWEDSDTKNRQRSIGAALELAVRRCITSQNKNKFGGWRYSPDSTDADTSVSGAVLMGLLAARNAGIEVPDTSIDKALQYFKSNTSDSGMVAYSGGIGGQGVSMNRSAVAALVYAVGKKKDWKEFEATLTHVSKRLEHQGQGYQYYFRYYMAQALFQGDFDAWTKWNRENTRVLKGLQQDDGSFQSGHGQGYGTGMALLAIALNYRFLPIYER